MQGPCRSATSLRERVGGVGHPMESGIAEKKVGYLKGGYPVQQMWHQSVPVGALEPEG